jgi:hypothetical protein
MEQHSLFPETLLPVPDEEVVEVLRTAILGGGRLSRLAELYLGDACAWHLINALHIAGLRVTRPAAPQLRE